MPTFNTSEFLDAAIQSVLQQQLPPGFRIELLVVDDGSTAAAMLQTLARIEAQKHSTIRVFRMPRNGGVSRARNFGIAQARGRYLAFLDSDDLWVPDHLCTHLGLMLETGVGITGSDYDSVQADGTVHSPAHFANHPRKGLALRQAFASGKPVVYETPTPMFIDCCPTTTTVITIDRKQFAEDEVRFAEHLLQAEDLHLWTRLAANSSFCFTPRATAMYRNNPESLSRRVSLRERAAWHVAALEDLSAGAVGRRWGPQLQTRLCEALVTLAYTHRKVGEFRLALLVGIRALSVRPTYRPAIKETLRAGLAAVVRR